MYYNEELLLADTDSGKAWLKKAVHPPGVTDPAFCGYPDDSSIPAVHNEYRLQAEVLTTCINAPDTMLMLHTPSLLHPIAVAQALTSPPVWTHIKELENDQIDVQSVAQQMGRLQATAISKTIMQDSTAINEAGMCYAAQFSPSTYILTLGQLTEKIVHNYDTHKHWIPHLVKHFGSRIHRVVHQMMKYGHSFHHAHNIVSRKSPKFRGKDDYVEVTLTDTRIYKRPNDDKRSELKDKCCDDDDSCVYSDFPEFDKNDIGSDLVYEYSTVQVVKLGNCIFQPTDVTMLSPKSYTGRSKDGQFIVQQINQHGNPWVDVRQGEYNTAADNKRNLMFSAYETSLGPNYNLVISPFVDNVGDLIQDTVWPGWTWAYSMFTNISSGSLGGPPPKFAIKTILDFAIAPTTRSVLNPSCKPPALYDQQALKSYAVITQSRQDALMAKYNIIGEAINAMKTAKTAVDSIHGAATTIKDLAGITKRADQNIKENAAIENGSETTAMTEQNQSLSQRFGRMTMQPKFSMQVAAPRNRSASRKRSQSVNRKPKTVIIYRSKSAPRQRSKSRNRTVKIVKTKSKSKPNTRKRSNSRR